MDSQLSQLSAEHEELHNRLAIVKTETAKEYRFTTLQ